MQHLEVSGAVQRLQWSLGVKGLIYIVWQIRNSREHLLSLL